jgi:sirohydrochlorin cobaltochelatase
MIKKLISAALFGIILFSVFSNPALAAENKKKRPKTGKAAIILASFGTTVPSAVESIINIQQKVQAAFPEVPVRVTFTSNIIRKVWKIYLQHHPQGLEKTAGGSQKMAGSGNSP